MLVLTFLSCPAKLASARGKESYRAETFLASESLLFNAVFLIYSFSLHLTLTEIYLDNCKKGGEPKQVHGA